MTHDAARAIVNATLPLTPSTDSRPEDPSRVSVQRATQTNERQGHPSQVLADGSAACAVDLSNLLANGERARLVLDLPRFAEALATRRVGDGRKVFRARPFLTHYKDLWERYGFQTVAGLANCDPLVIKAAIDFAEEGYREIVIVGGDGDYFSTVELLRTWGLHVEVWSRRHKLAPKLAAAASRVQFIDDFLIHASRPRSRKHLSGANSVQTSGKTAGTKGHTNGSGGDGDAPIRKPFSLTRKKPSL